MHVSVKFDNLKFAIYKLADMVREHSHRLDSQAEKVEKCHWDNIAIKQVTQVVKSMVNNHEDKIQKLSDSFNIYDHRLNRLEIDNTNQTKQLEEHTKQHAGTAKTIEQLERKIYSL